MKASLQPEKLYVKYCGWLTSVQSSDSVDPGEIFKLKPFGSFCRKNSEGWGEKKHIASLGFDRVTQIPDTQDE